MFDAIAATASYFAATGAFAGNYDTDAATEALRDAFADFPAEEVTTDDLADVIEHYRW